MQTFFVLRTCVAAMTLKKNKNAPHIFQGFQHQKVAWHCGKITIFEKKKAFLGARFPVRRDVFVY